jgi:hypothetical protein
MPEVWRIKKAILSGVHFEAAMNRSPSFSRSSSSVTMTNSPFAKASIASATVAGRRSSASTGSNGEMKSFGVTAPFVSRKITSAVSRESQAASLLHNWVMADGDKRVRRANSTRETLLAVSQSVSFMRTMMGRVRHARNMARSAVPRPISALLQLP